MGITTQLVRLNQKELDEILADKSGQKLQTLLDEWRRRPGYDEFESLCWRYTHASVSQKGMRWHGSTVEELAEKSGISHEQIEQEVQKLGLHLWLDLEKHWNEMHALLTGKPLVKRPAACPTTGEERSHYHELCTQTSADLDKSQAEIQSMVIELKELLTNQANQEAHRAIGQQVVFAPQFLVQTKVAIQKLDENYDDDVIESCEETMRDAARSATKLKELMKGLLEELQEERFSEAGKTSQTIFVDTRNLNQHQQKILATMYAKPKKQVVDEGTTGDGVEYNGDDILSAAITGATKVSDSLRCRYLSVEQVKNVAAKLKSLNFTELAKNAAADNADFEHCFDKMHEFYIDAAD